ncbi:hypothetical protein HZS_6498 [Henneguya salminicola]|nr:hypothetical protein HZS_6498 [Henneguya salminicola]
MAKVLIAATVLWVFRHELSIGLISSKVLNITASAFSTRHGLLNSFMPKTCSRHSTFNLSRQYSFLMIKIFNYVYR